MARRRSRATYVGNFQQADVAALDYWSVYSTIPMGQLMHDFDPSFDLTTFGCDQPAAAAGEYSLVKCLSAGQDSPGWLGVLYGGDGRPFQPGCAAGNACPRVVAAMNVFTAAPTRYCGLHNVQQLGDLASINVQSVPGQPACVSLGHITYWKFLTDPHGQDTTNTSVVVDHYFDGGGHWDYGPLGRLTEFGPGWAAVFGNIMDNLDKPLSLVIDDSPAFAGAKGLSYGSTTSKHPSYHQVAGVAPPNELGWFMDAMSFDGGQFYSDNAGATSISGQLYRWNAGEGPPLARKVLATLAVSGGHSLIDVSGPGSALSDSPADSYKYCVAMLAGECRAGSLPGQVFVNAPSLTSLRCNGSDGPLPQNLDICIGNFSTFSQAITQMVMGNDSADSIARSRIISRGLSGVRNSFYYWTAKSLPDASWALFTRGAVAPGFGDLLTVWMAKLPPLPVPDGIDRTTFLPLRVDVTPPPNPAITGAVVRFGYAEQGDPSKFYCTSRRETCLATSPAFTQENPFQYAQTESYTGVPCSGSCQITIPVLPMHVVYYQVLYLNASGGVVGTGKSGVSAEFAQASVSGGATLTPPTTIRTTVTTVPAGLSLSIDGVAYRSPAMVSWTPGSNHTLAVIAPPANAGTRLAFSRWSTGEPTLAIAVQAPPTDSTYIATFTTEYQLTTTVDPASTGSITGAGWYPTGAVASVQASALAGYTFLQFSGNLSGAANPQSLLMDGPKTVTASFRSTTAAAAPVLEAGVIAKTSSEDGRSLWTILFSNSGAGAATDAQDIERDPHADWRHRLFPGDFGGHPNAGAHRHHRAWRERDSAGDTGFVGVQQHRTTLRDRELHSKWRHVFLVGDILRLSVSMGCPCGSSVSGKRASSRTAAWLNGQEARLARRERCGGQGLLRYPARLLLRANVCCDTGRWWRGGVECRDAEYGGDFWRRSGGTQRGA